MKNEETDVLLKVEQLEKRVERLKAENKRLKEKYQTLIDSTYQNAQRLSPMGLRDALIKQMGKKAYLKKILTDKKGKLWTVDKQMLIDMIDGKADKKAEAVEVEMAVEAEDASKDEI